MNADDYRVGEKYRYHILGENIHSYHEATDRDVQRGREFFTKGFGVRITSIKDLDALDVGVDEYFKRPDKSDISREAVHRAVILKQTYFPGLKWKWNIDDFNRIPYAAPIPNLQFGAPPLEAKDLELSLPALTGTNNPGISKAQQLSSQTLVANSAENAGDSSFFKKSLSYAKKNWWLALLPMPVIAIILIIKHKRK